MIKIMGDSTCDLSEDILEKYNADLAPLVINFQDKTYQDRIDITPDELYQMMKERMPHHPTTAMPSPTEFLKIMNKAVCQMVIRKFSVFVCLAELAGRINQQR